MQNLQNLQNVLNLGVMINGAITSPSASRSPSASSSPSASVSPSSSASLSLSPSASSSPSSGEAQYIKSIQHFEISLAPAATTGTATINSVNVGSSAIFYNGAAMELVGNNGAESPWLTLTNATTITATRTATTDDVTVSGMIIEFYPGMATVEYGTITIASGASTNTATISSVDTNNSFALWLGSTASDAAIAANYFSTIRLTDATTVTAERGTTPALSVTLGFCVVQLDPSVFVSIQRRSITVSDNSLTFTDTISAVDTTKSVVIFNGYSSPTIGSAGLYRLELTDATTITGSRTVTTTGDRTVQCLVLEFESALVTSKQAGTIAVSGAVSNTATITSVDTAKAALFFGFASANGTTLSSNTGRATLTNATTVTAARGVNNGTFTATYQVIEMLVN